MAQTPARKIQANGRYLQHTPVADVTAGDIVLIGDIPHIADGDIPAGKPGDVCNEGIYDVPKDASTFTAGDAVYWNAAGNPVVGTAGTGAASSTAGANLMGFATEDAATGDANVRLKLTAAKRTATIAGSVTADDITGSDASLGVAGKAGGTDAAGGIVAIAGGAGNGTGAGGAASLAGGLGGATGAGGAVAIAGGAGGATSGTGGAASLAGGAGTAGNANGGAVNVLGGNAHGSGTDGVLNLGTSNTSAVNIGAAGVGPFLAATPRFGHTVTPVAAAGSTIADAAALADTFITHITSDGAAKGVKLPAVTAAGVVRIVVNNSSTAAELYAESTGTVNGAAADASMVIPASKGVLCISTAAKTWIAFDLPALASAS